MPMLLEKSAKIAHQIVKHVILQVNAQLVGMTLIQSMEDAKLLQHPIGHVLKIFVMLNPLKDAQFVIQDTEKTLMPIKKLHIVLPVLNQDALIAPLTNVMHAAKDFIWTQLPVLAKLVMLDVLNVLELELVLLALEDFSPITENAQLVQLDAQFVNLQLNVPPVIVNIY